MVEELVNADGKESPLSFGGENLGEEDSQMPMVNGLDDDDTDVIDKILYMQNIGLSNSDKIYNEQQLQLLPPEELRKVYDSVFGNVKEASKPTKTRHHLDDIDDILAPRPEYPLIPDDSTDADDEEEKASDDTAVELPRASAASTRQRTQNITPSDVMRDYLNRINPDVGANEPDIPDTPQNELVVRTATDVPAVISNAIQSVGMQNPEWHTINNLPGFMQRNIRGMGRQVFGMMTRTPLEQIQTIANVEGQGPNTSAELRAVVGWLRDSAEDLGPVEIGHGMAIPGYEPDVREYRKNGIRFHVVRDPMGQYIYAYPDADARINNQNNQDRLGNRQQGDERMPRRLRESLTEILKPTLFERIMWDEEINKILKKIDLKESQWLDESTLSRKIGKEQGGQNLVKWLHRRHKLSNEADLVPVSFKERIFWKQFKSNPDDFVIVSAENGVAGIKPDENYIKKRTAEYQKKGRTYNPSVDHNLPYQIIAFTDDGTQIDPALLRAPDDNEGRDAEDPTVTRARMGVHSGKDIQNPYNVFNLLSEQIGTLRTVWIVGFENVKDGEPGTGAVEREKMKKRSELKASPEMSEAAAMQKIFSRVRPVLKTLGNQAILQINRRMQRYIEGGNFEGAQKLAASGTKLKQFLAAIDTAKDITIDTSYGSPTRELSNQIKRAISNASGSPVGSDEYNSFLQDAATGSALKLKPILDSLRDSLVGLQ
jgi:hypothetical protein